MADKIGSEEKEKSLYLTQIQHLDEQLERCQLKCDELEKQNKDLVSQHSALEKDKRDITQYLKHAVDATEKKAEQLAEQLESQQKAVEQETETLELQHRQEVQEIQNRVDELDSDCMTKAAKFEEQQEQLMQLKQHLSDTESLEKQLVSQKEEHKASLDSLKWKAKLERTKLIEEIENEVSDCAKRKTSQILQEERAVHSERLEEFQVLLNKNMELWKEKHALQSQERDLFSEITKLKKAVNKFTTESHTHKMEGEQLKEYRQELGVELKDCSIAHEQLLVKEEALSQQLVSVSEECRQNTAEVAQLGAELQEERTGRRQLEVGVQEAVTILRHILTQDSERTSETQWKMKKLLDILERNAPRGTGSAPKDSTEESSGGQKPQPANPEPARAEILNLATDPLFLMVRYRPGDLGLVPRPTWKHKPPVSRTDAPSSSTQLPPDRRRSQTSSSVDPSSAPQQADPEEGASNTAGS